MKKYNLGNKAQVIQDLKTSKNMSNFLKNIGMTSYGGVKYWIHKYNDKIVEHHVKININKNYTRYKEDVNFKILNEVKTNNNISNKNLIKIAKSNNVPYQHVRKIIKNLDIDLYKKLELSISDKRECEALTLQKKRLEYLTQVDKNNLILY